MAKEEIVLKGYDDQTKNFQKLADSLAQSNIEARSTAALQLKTDKEQLEKFAELLKETGIEAKDSQKYRDEELRIRREGLALRKQGATSKAAREEIAKEESALQSNRFEKFFGQNSFVGKSLGGLGDKLGNLVPGGVKGILGTLGTVAVLGALVTFLQSDTWKNLKDKIIPKLAEGLEAFKNSFSEFVTDITAFFEAPSFSSFMEIFTGDSSTFVAALAGITLLLAPLTSLTILKLGVQGLLGAVNLLGSALNLALGSKVITTATSALATGLKGAISALGSGLKNSILGGGGGGPGRLTKDGRPDMRFTQNKKPSGGMKALGKGLLRGAKFLPVVGVGITALMAVFDGVSAGLEEAKNENSTKATILRESVAGIASGLTFGFISQEAISSGITATASAVASGWELTKGAYTKFLGPDAQWAKDLTEKTKAGVKSLKALASTAVTNAKESISTLVGKIPSLDEIGASLTKFGTLIKEKFSFKFSDLKLPDIPDFGAIFMDVIRGILKPIVGMRLLGISVRSILSKVSIGKNLLNFVDQTGSFTPPPPARSAESIQQSEIDRFLKMGQGGSAPIIIQQTSNNVKQGDKFAFMRAIPNDAPGMREAASSL